MSTILGNPITLGGGDIKISKVLDENSWKVIKWASENNVGANFWSVGDCKQITMNGKVSDGLTLTDFATWVFIIGFDHNKDYEGTGIAFQGFKTAQLGGKDTALVDSGYSQNKTSGQWFNLNNTYSNRGGWQESLMRKNIMPLIKAAFPSDLQAVIKTSTIYTDNTGNASGNVVPTTTQDDVFLLAEYEIFGVRSYATTQEANYLKQYAYYAAGNSKVKYKHNATDTGTSWWERSPDSRYGSNFCLCSYYGNNNFTTLSISDGVAPCFKV